MRARSAAGVAAVAAGAGVCAQAAALAFVAWNPGSWLGDEPSTAVGMLIAFGAVGLAGALLAARVPGNPLGWLLLAVFTLVSWLLLAQEYAVYSFVAPGERLPGAVLAAWVAVWAWYPSMVLLLVFVPLLFPTGRLMSRRWRPVAWAAATGLVLMTANAALAEQLVFDSVAVPNPVGVPGVVAEQGPVDTVGWALVGVGLIGAIVSVAMRFRGSRGVERLQMKWMLFAAGTIGTVILLGELGVPLPDGVGNLLFAVAVALLPLAIGVAVLRYRLYEIDRLISRTLSYALVTGVLVATYLVAVLVASRVLAPLGAGSELAVAAATLAAAAVFAPARRRIQQAVDRRFNRARYSAEQVVASFRQKLRDEVALGDVVTATGDAVHRALAPAGISLWLRDSTDVVQDRRDL